MMAMVLELGLAGPLSGEGILLVILPGFSPYPPPAPLPALQSPATALPCLTLPATHWMSGPQLAQKHVFNDYL